MANRRMILAICLCPAIVFLSRQLLPELVNDHVPVHKTRSKTVVPEFLTGLRYETRFQSKGHLDSDILEKLIPVHYLDESDEAKRRNEELIKYHEKLKTSKVIKKRRPDILHAGVKKCGTTWIKFVLGWHPSIRTVSHPDSLQDFLDNQIPYEQDLPDAEEDKFVLEPDMVYLKPLTPEMIYNNFPEAKFYMIVCEPSARSFSDFVHLTVGGKLQPQNGHNELTEKQTRENFDAYLNENLPKAKQLYQNLCKGGTELPANQNFRIQTTEASVFWLGLYYARLQRYLKYYSKDQFYIINGEELYKHPGKVIEKIQEFFGLPKLLIADDFIRNPETGLFCIAPTIYLNSKLYKTPGMCLGDDKGRTRATSSYRKASDESLAKLKSFYKCFDDKFFELIGRRFW